MIQRVATLLLLLAVVGGPAATAGAAPEGQLTWAMHTAIAPLWFDPGEATGQITQMIYWYAIHDALVKPMPGKPMAPSLAESWTLSKDGLVYEFVLRKNATFHNGDPVTAEDAKFSFERYRGAAAKGLVGAGPYRVVSFNPGIEMVLEAHGGYWRKAPAVRRLVFRNVPDESTRLAMLKRGEVDIAYSLRGPLAEEVRRTPGLKLSPTLIPATFWVDFTAEQWDPKSPWHDRRVRLAASLAIDRKAINDAETLGHSRVASSIIPSGYEFYWPAPPIPYDPAQSRKLLAEAGHPNGFDAGDYTCDAAYANLGEAVASYLGAVGIRARLRPLERAAWTTQWREKKVRHLLQGAGGGLGNAVTRIDNYLTARGVFGFGSYPEIEDLYQQQARELDRKKREALLHQIQRLAYERVMFAPIWELGFLNGVGPRVEEAGLGLIEYQPYSTPYEDLKLRRP